jgi:hypothetical protein
MAKPSRETQLAQQANQTAQSELVTDNNEIIMTEKISKDSPSLYGNLDKECKYLLPAGFDTKSDYLVEMWRIQVLEDNTVIPIPASINVVVYDEANFDESFKGYRAGSNTPLERSLGMKYKVLHDPEAK